uniref:Taste receptor type 2 n=2 Tax=Latimeria chalumnae TaxID=7897 RepID=H3A2X9_LATCH
MLPSVQFSLWIINSFIIVASIFGNLFVFLMNYRSYRRKGYFLPCELICCALSAISGFLEVVFYLWMSMSELDRSCLISQACYISLLLVIFSLHSALLWITAFLLFFYSAKIVIEPIHCYTKVQDAILKHAPTVLAAIFFFSFTFNIPLIILNSKHTANETNTQQCGNLVVRDKIIFLSIYLPITAILPAVVMVKSSISILVHLMIHLRHLKANTNGFHTPKLSSQMRVVRMTLVLTIVYLIALITYVLCMTFAMINNNRLFEIAGTAASIYTMASSLILSYGKQSHWNELAKLWREFVALFP